MDTHSLDYQGADDRLDRVVAERLGGGAWSRSQVERWIHAGSVTVNARVVTKPSWKVSAGDRIDVRVPPPQKTHLVPLEFPLEILFEDRCLIVLNKPAGISMHPGAGNPQHTIANAVVHHVGAAQQGVGEVDRPGIVHRLDKDTTGVVVIAKTPEAHAALSRQFAERSVGRSYFALVYTTPRAVRAVQTSNQGEVSVPIGRHPTNRKIMAVVPTGRPATTHWRVIERFTHGTLIECRLRTGRTHQIRVHMNSIGSPLIGDQAYGDFSNLPKRLKDAAVRFGRQALHAGTLEFAHPVTAERLSFTAPLPADLEGLIATFREEQSAA
jgi:23S rRNA pseudouridine1911/1915/1917 synthase